MIFASKYLPFILVSALSNTSVAKDPTLGRLRGLNRNRPGIGNGSEMGKLRKLDAEGCTVLEKAYLCTQATKGGKPVPCEDETREFACEVISTGQIYRVEDDLIDISKGNKPGLDVEAYADVLQSANALFVGDANIDAARATIKFNHGRFGKANPNKNRGRILQSVGSPTVLALNVISSENATTGYTNAHLADSVFGSLVGGTDLVTLASQVRACSHGKLNFGPLPDKTSSNTTLVGDVSSGVATVYSTVSAASGPGALRNDATSKLATAHGRRGGADHVMVCLPDASLGFNPYAYINHWLSVYPHGACPNSGIQIHEIGHNLGLGHSGEGSNAYGDRSGFMGFAGQKMCYNGPKNWQLGWFADRHMTVTAGSDSFSGRLYGTTQYDNTNSADKMILRLHDPACTTCDVYISFNHDADYNSGTAEGQNKVQVHTKAGTPGSSKFSYVVARLGAGDLYTATVNGKEVNVVVSFINAEEGWAEIIVAPGASAAPTTAPPTTALPTSFPTFKPEKGSFYTACGSTVGGCSGRATEADVAESHELRCCADSAVSSFFSKHDECPLNVWGASQFEGTCYHSVTWNDGRNICEQYGGRLCTKDELLADCTRASGCSHNQDMIWSSTRVETLAPTPPPTASPSKSPSVSPTKNPSKSPSLSPTTNPTDSPRKAPSQSPTYYPSTSPTGSPSVSPTKGPTPPPAVSPSASPTASTSTPSPTSYNFLHKVVCGSTDGNCRNSPVLLANIAEGHQVRCCSETKKTGWVKKAHCDVWGESHLPTCNAAKTYAEAEAICAANGARICTEPELLNDCTRGSGCGYDDERHWSSSTVPKCTDDTSCDDGLPCTTDTCGADGKCTNEAIGCGKLVACGSTADECVGPAVKGADPGELHEVRCCSDEQKSGWVMNSLCSTTLGRDVWGQSNGSLGSCHRAKTYAEAEAICIAGGSRLCTSEEVRADCTRGE